MPGFGSAPYGSAPYGIGTPGVAIGPTGRVFLDPKTGVQTGSRRIDPETKDYAFDESGRIEGMADTHQLVVLALSTVRGSSAVRSLGHTINSVKVVTAGMDVNIRKIVENALSDLIADKRIRLNDVKTVRLRPGAFAVRVFWTDLSTNLEFEERI